MLYKWMIARFKDNRFISIFLNGPKHNRHDAVPISFGICQYEPEMRFLIVRGLKQ